MPQQTTRIGMSPFRAATIHLFFSLLMAGALSILIFKVWYPNSLAAATGVFVVFAIVFAVNLISGPLLTLLVYKKNKKSLVFDLTVIVIIQLAALIYGIYSLSQARPVWIVFYNNRFETVRLNDIESIYLKNSPTVYSHPSLLGPRWVAAKPVGSKKHVEDLVLWDKMGAKIAHQPTFYYPIEKAYSEIKVKSYDLSKLEVSNNPVAISRQVIVNPKVAGWLPLWGQEKHMVVFIDKNGFPLNVVDLRPWTEQQMSTYVTTTK